MSGRWTSAVERELLECRAEARGERWLRSWSLIRLGLAQWNSGRHREAADHFREAPGARAVHRKLLIAEDETRTRLISEESMAGPFLTLFFSSAKLSAGLQRWVEAIKNAVEIRNPLSAGTPQTDGPIRTTATTASTPGRT